MSLPLPEVSTLIGTLINLGLYPFVVWIVLEVKDLSKRQLELEKSNTVIAKVLIKKHILEPEEISGIRLG